MEKEKRRHPRFNSLNTVAYFCLDENADAVSQGMGRTINLSKSGILLHTFRSIDTSHLVRVHIGLKQELVDLLGKVQHCSKDPEKGFHYGIEFVDIAAENRVVLDRFVRVFNASLQRPSVSGKS